MTKSSKSLWARFLFQDRGIVPTKRLLKVFFVLSILLIIGSIRELSWTTIITINIVVLLGSLYDLRLSPKKNQLLIKRTASAEMEREIVYQFDISIDNLSRHSLSFRLLDGLP
ncbi:hypothetical protein [Neobacillus fumarioli]|uniref:hypothetical protein n=1 Tax=Neobacillus fumarioli TaxID=105229 RepID=UPI00350E4C19